jgi:hypothetical protein
MASFCSRRGRNDGASCSDFVGCSDFVSGSDFLKALYLSEYINYDKNSGQGWDRTIDLMINSHAQLPTVLLIPTISVGTILRF